jgi:hypothetical protein
VWEARKIVPGEVSWLSPVRAGEIWQIEACVSLHFFYQVLCIELNFN